MRHNRRAALCGHVNGYLMSHKSLPKFLFFFPFAKFLSRYFPGGPVLRKAEIDRRRDYCFRHINILYTRMKRNAGAILESGSHCYPAQPPPNGRRLLGNAFWAFSDDCVRVMSEQFPPIFPLNMAQLSKRHTKYFISIQKKN